MAGTAFAAAPLAARSLDDGIGVPVTREKLDPGRPPATSVALAGATAPHASRRTGTLVATPER